jgi:malonate-semialdehyde dehydrogenase (acetylating)/methylmalonate-semialdehyde dehydrogenase
MSASAESATTSPAATDGPKKLHHVINGKAVSGSPGATAEVFNPATGQVTATVPMADAATTKLAIEAAASAFPGWAETPPL